MTADTTPAFRLAAQEYDPAIPVATISEHPDNPNEGNTGVLDESLAEHGFYGAIIVQRSTCYILAGNHRHREAVAAGATTLPGFWLDVDDEQAAKIMAVDNESTRLGRTNAARLVALLKPLTDLRGTGYTEAQLAALLRGQGEGGTGKPPPNLADRFLIPPFDVLDARIGWWRDRKRAWLALGITSEVGREGLLAVTNVAAHDPTYYDQKDATEHRLGHELTRAEFEARHYTPAQWGGINAGGTSIFDPVLCELAYRWWCPPGGHVIDPFAGGSVRGLMAAMLGRAYTGCDLSQAQVTANAAAAADFAARGLLAVRPPQPAGRRLVIHPATLRRQLDCTVEGITAPDGCGGKCCRTKAFWPPNAQPQGDGVSCHYLGATGCTLDPAADKPIKCLLYPLIEKPGRDLLPLYFRAPNGTCKACYGHGPTVAEALAPSIAALAGDDAAAEVLAAAAEDRDAVLILPPAVAAALDAEAVEEAAGILPPPRSTRPAPPAPGQLYGPHDATPVEEHGGYLVKRDDLYTVGGSAGGKVRTCLALAQGATGLVTAGSRQSPQVNIVATIAEQLGLPCAVHVPAAAGPLTPELQAAQEAGAEVREHRPGHNSVIIRRAKDDAAARGWRYIPFGMETPEAVAQTATQVPGLECHTFRRIVVPVGSGMTLAGILAGLDAAGMADVPVLGVVVGASPEKRLDRYAPGWRDHVTLIPAGLDYHAEAPVTRLGGLQLDPIYEAKCLPYLESGDLLWVVGCRETARPAAIAAPSWQVGDAVQWAPGLPPGSADMVFTCPPYFDLETYSDDPADLSTMTDAEFAHAMHRVLAGCAQALRPARFAVVVTGDARNGRGVLRDMRGLVIQAAAAAGLTLASAAVYWPPLGAIRINAGRTFAATRTLSRTHQDLLVFVKGSRAAAAAACGHVDVTVPDELAEQLADTTPGEGQDDVAVQVQA